MAKLYMYIYIYIYIYIIFYFFVPWFTYSKYVVLVVTMVNFRKGYFVILYIFILQRVFVKIIRLYI